MLWSVALLRVEGNGVKMSTSSLARIENERGVEHLNHTTSLTPHQIANESIEQALLNY